MINCRVRNRPGGSFPLSANASANAALEESVNARVKGHRRIGTVREIAERWGLAGRLSRAYAADRRIVLNARLLENGCEEDRDATFLHECAHVLADLFHERPCRHGDRWREMMRLLGEAPNVRHRIPYLSREANAKIVWRCTGCAQAYHYVRRPRRRLKDCYCADCGPVRGRLREETPS